MYINKQMLFIYIFHVLHKCIKNVFYYLKIVEIFILRYSKL
jgi:hypothetical protein